MQWSSVGENLGFQVNAFESGSGTFYSIIMVNLLTDVTYVYKMLSTM